MKIVPNLNCYAEQFLDDTPRIVLQNAVGARQRILAQIRHNRLIDRFFGLPSYSLGSWSGKFGKTQIEIDEVYVAVDKHGRQFVIPVQAKGGHDHHGVVQTFQDIAWCAHKLPDLISRPVSVQFVTDTKIAMFELCDKNGVIKIVDEKHYELVPADRISLDDLKSYQIHAKEV